MILVMLGQMRMVEPVLPQQPALLPPLSPNLPPEVVGVTSTSSASISGSSRGVDFYAPHWELYPRSYAVARAPYSLLDSLDGNIDKAAWRNVPYSAGFADIQGADAPGYDNDNNNTDVNDNDNGTTTTTRSTTTTTRTTAAPLQPAPTRFKALYDDDYLYIAAVLHAAPGLSTPATYTERNSPIYQRDSDFEVFVDAAHTNHNYKELEINAINTVWNLRLDKPYTDGGTEHSGRVAPPGAKHYYEVHKQRTAAVIVSGAVNDGREGATWTVELALAYTDIWAAAAAADTQTTTTTAAAAPIRSNNDDNHHRHHHNNDDNTNKHRRDKGVVSPPTPPPAPRTPPTLWRVNFSRVERCGAVNWTWQPQRRWDPLRSRYAGFVAMHMPDAWGYLHFVPDSNNNNAADADAADSGNVDESTTTTAATTTNTDAAAAAAVLAARDAFWPAKLTAMTVYYALHQYQTDTGRYTEQLADLILPAAIVAPFDICIALTSNSSHSSNDDRETPVPGAGGFLITAASTIDDTCVQVRDDRYLTTSTTPSTVACGCVASTATTTTTDGPVSNTTTTTTA